MPFKHEKRSLWSGFAAFSESKNRRGKTTKKLMHFKITDEKTGTGNHFATHKKKNTSGATMTSGRNDPKMSGAGNGRTI